MDSSQAVIFQNIFSYHYLFFTNNNHDNEARKEPAKAAKKGTK